MVSGSHFNPIVTVGLLLRDAIVDSINKKKVLKALLYVVAQFVGYFIAAYVSWAVTGVAFHISSGDSGMVAAYAGEALFAAQLLLFIILIGVQWSLILGASLYLQA